MSSGQGENVLAKAEDDAEIQSPSEVDKTASKDQVDHVSVSSLDKDAKGFTELITEDSSLKTDSGFKDNLLSAVTGKTKSVSDNTDDNSDDELELKWEDDENDEQNATPLEKVQEAIEQVSEIAKPTEAVVDDSNLSSNEELNEEIKEVDENKLLNSSPSKNEDTNLSSTSNFANIDVPLNKFDENVAISENVHDIIDENRLLKSPDSEVIDEEKLNEIPDENLEDSLLDDDLTETDLNPTKSVPEKSQIVPSEKSEPISIGKALKIDIEKDMAKEESQNDVTVTTLVTKTNTVSSENISQDIANLESALPTQYNSLVFSPGSPNDSASNTTLNINTEHGLNKPDMMLEIPTQEIIELIDESDISIVYKDNDDDQMEVDDANDSTEAHIVDVTEEKEQNETTLDENATAMILKPADAFRALDTKNPSKESSQEANKIKDVSEDDWCEIEKRLEGFEDSVIEAIQLGDISMTEELENVKDTQEKNYLSSPINSNDKVDKEESTETLPLSEAQKNVIDLENKELLKTLLDTSKLDSTEEDQIITTMEVEEQTLLIQPLISTENSNNDDNAQKTKNQSDLDKTKEATSPTNEKEIEAISDLEDQQLISIKPSDEIDIVDSNPKSPLKLTEEMDSQVEITNEQLESSKSETKLSTPDLSLLDKEKTMVLPLESTKGDDDESTNPKDDVESSNEKDVDSISKLIEVQTSTTLNDDKVPSLTLVEIPSKPSIENENNTKTSELDIENTITTEPQDKFEIQPTEMVTDDVEASTFTMPIVDEVVPSTSVDDSLTASHIDEKKVTSVNKAQIEVTSTVEDEPSTCEVLPSTAEDIPSISKVEAPSTSTVDDIEVLPSTADISTSKNNEVPSTSKVDDIEVLPSTADISTSKDNEVPSTSKVDDIEIQPSTSKAFDDIKLDPTATDPDSADDVPETSDSLGLLAESSRVMEDDEDDDDADGDGDDDDEYEIEDESSNQMTAEHSEDSNAPQSETDVPKDQDGKEMEIESPMEEKGEDEFSFAVNDVTEDKDKANEEEKDGGMDEDEEIVQDDIEVTPEQIGSEATLEAVQSTEISVESNETESDKDKPKQANKDTDKPSDTSDQADAESVLRKLLVMDENKDTTKTSDSQKSPSKKLGVAQFSNVLNIVDLEESSSEDDIQEVKKEVSEDSGTLIAFEGYKITIPSSVDVSTVPMQKEPDISSEQTVVTNDKDRETPVKADGKQSEDKSKVKLSLEVFSLDSDEDERASAPATDQKKAEKTDKASESSKSIDKATESNKCINVSCTSTGTVTYYRADPSAIAYFDAAKRKKTLICEECQEFVVSRAERLVNAIKDLTPLLDLDSYKVSSELVEISDSDSDEDGDSDEPKETLGDSGSSFVQANLAQLINDTWTKYCMDSRLDQAANDLNEEVDRLQAESKEIDKLLAECQVETDKLRNDLYATFEHQRREIAPIVIYDTPVSKYSCLEKEQHPPENLAENRVKRRMSSATEIPPKRPAIPLGYTPLDSDTAQAQENRSLPIIENTKAEDDKDISVLKVSAESAPSDLPPPGELVRPPLRPGMGVYAMRNAFGCWIRSRILEVNGKSAVLGMTQTFTVCRVKYEHKPKGQAKLSPARCLAYSEPATVRLTIGTRVIALFKDSQNPLKRDAFYSGIISEVPNPVNNYRYLVFFDDGYAQYVQHRDTRLVCECSPLVWEEVHPFSREFVREYLLAYPERPMVRLHAGQSLKTEWNGKWWTSRVIQVDASLVQVHFDEDNRTEWIYRGSTRLAPLFLELQAAERHRARPMPRTKAQPRINMPYVEYTRWDEQNKSEQPPAPAPTISDREIRQRAVAKKSTSLPVAPNTTAPSSDSVTSRVVYYTPKNAVKPYKMSQHSCGPHCKRKDVLALKDLRTYNPLAKPLLSGWERQIVRYKGHKEVMYRAPCGRRLRSLRELHRYLRLVHSDMAVDLFDFTPHTHCLAEFVLNKCLVGKKDLSHGKENVPVPCVNYYDESLPEFCSYNTERTPTAGVPLNIDPEFLCGCDCTDDCEDKSKCACWQMTLEGARTIGLKGPNVGYKYKRLPEPLPSGIYECNSRCKCKHTCLNRVAQHPLQLKLQVFKTLNRGWGIRALNDIPKGSFLCVYAGNLLTDATANMDGLNEGDEYLAELDYIEVVEQMKEGYEEDIPDAAKRLDKKTGGMASEESEVSSSEQEDETPSKDEKDDGDFCPKYATDFGVSEFSKRLRKRKKKNKQDGGSKEKEKDGDKTGEDCITISDDEEVREPSRFMAQAGMGKEFISKYRSVRTYFGKDEACYIMDAKVQGNIGRYLNHSCQPNVFVQNVFVDTHDPRFPWVAFFALSHIKAGTELTWNYNYDVGSVPGKVLYCYCGATNCRGRLL